MRVVFDAKVIASGVCWDGEAYLCLVKLARRQAVAFGTEETLAETKVGEARLVVGVDHDVGRPEIVVQSTRVSRVLDGLGHLVHVAGGALGWDGSVAHELGEVLARHVIHRKEVLPRAQTRPTGLRSDGTFDSQPSGAGLSFRLILQEDPANVTRDPKPKLESRKPEQIRMLKKNKRKTRSAVLRAGAWLIPDLGLESCYGCRIWLPLTG